VCAALGYFVVRYRARAGRRAAHDHGDGRGSLGVTLALAATVFLSVDLNLVRRAHADLSDAFWAFPAGADAVRVDVLAQQWAWHVRYPGPDGRFGTDDDVTTLNDLRLPVDTPIVVQLKAKDVIHSFYLPNLRVKQDAIPGEVTRTWFQSRKTGRYEI